MNNKSVSDFVAATMDAVLNSAEHKALFGTQYKFAQDLNNAGSKDSMCSKHNKMDSCSADDQDAKKKKESGDSSKADDQDAKKGKMPPWLKDKSDSASADDNDAKKKKDSSKDSSGDSSDADDQDAKKKKESGDSSDADD